MYKLVIVIHLHKIWQLDFTEKNILEIGDNHIASKLVGNETCLQQIFQQTEHNSWSAQIKKLKDKLSLKFNYTSVDVFPG